MSTTTGRAALPATPFAPGTSAATVAPRRSARAALGTALLLAILAAALVVRTARPPAPLPATAPATAFSAERAMRHVRAIAERPHPIGSADHERVRAYIMAELSALGLQPRVQEATGVGTRYAIAGHVRNVLARLPGRTPGGPAVLLLSHYDGVPAGPAAGDDASGSAVLLETLRALRAGGPLAHDVIALFSDGEEAGLLGAAAFVREHPWAKDVAVTLNFEARGTTGRSFMFETGPGNLDAARTLRGAGDVSATSLSVALYRTLPNDTDLSELHVLGKPALNFAFADGVERYHTVRDDVAHLNPGSVQHDGTQALAMVRAFGGGPLPRPETGDAVFFDLPFVGLVLYPESWAMPVAILTLLVALAALVRTARGEPHGVRAAALGVVGVLAAMVLASLAALGATLALAALHRALPGGGEPAWSGIYATGLALLALAVAVGCWALLRRWGGAASLHAGAIIVGALLALALTRMLPGGSFLLTWPVLGAALARLAAGSALDTRGAVAGRWLATLLAAAILVPIAYAIGAVMLGAAGPGAIAVALLSSLLAWLVAPQMEALTLPRRAATPLALAGLALAVFACGALTVRRSVDHPAPSGLTYALDADGGGAWLSSPAPWARPGSWGGAALGPRSREVPPAASTDGAPPAWLRRVIGFEVPTRAAPAPRLALGAPEAVVGGDSTAAGRRQLTLRIRGAPGTWMLRMQASGAPVLSAAIDGRAIDTTRYRRRSPRWSLDFAAPPDSGITLALTLAAGADPGLEMLQVTPGLPAIPGMAIPTRPADVSPAHAGDGTAVFRRVALRAH